MYSPKIKQDLVTKLYRIGKATHKPMTQIVDGILRDYIGKIHCSEGLSPQTNNAYAVSKKKFYPQYSSKQ